MEGHVISGIGEKAFYSCYELTSVELPEIVTEIGAYAFSLCSGLVSLTYLGDSEIKNDIGLLSSEGVKVFVKDGCPYRSFGGVPLTSNTSNDSNDSKKLGVGAIVGIIAGAVVLAVIIAGCVVFFVVSHNKEDEEQEREPI